MTMASRASGAMVSVRYSEKVTTWPTSIVRSCSTAMPPKRMVAMMASIPVPVRSGAMKATR